MQKIIRSVCLFTNKTGEENIAKLNKITSLLEENNFIIQTKRICSAEKDIEKLDKIIENKDMLLSVGTLSFDEAKNQLEKFYQANRMSFNIDLTNEDIEEKHISVLFDIIKNKPEQTFNFAYVFNNKQSSPFFPSANYERNGFVLGLQPTDLSENCQTLDEWLEKMKKVWNELFKLFKDDPDFIGIDSSIAPLFEGKESLINFIKRLDMDFSESVLTEIYLKIANHLKENNPKPIGLCGLMFPCLEDFELAEEYEKGNFSVERNIFLSLHSGLGIDTYPIGIDEKTKKVLEILRLLQGLSNKYNKPLSARFVSDGKTKIGEKTDFKNQYLKDVVVRKLK